MATPNPVSEDDLDSAFREGSVFGVQYLVSEFRDLILQHIKRAGRGFLNPDELAVVYQDTIVGVIEKTKERRPGRVPQYRRLRSRVRGPRRRRGRLVAPGRPAGVSRPRRG
jgi:hypothetical protein